MLDGIEYSEVTDCAAQIRFAIDHNLTMIFGYSDDLLEFQGTTRDEFGAYKGCVVIGGECRIEVEWCVEDESAWSYHLTGCGEYEKFRIMEDGELYSYGIVIVDPGIKWKDEDGIDVGRLVV